MSGKVGNVSTTLVHIVLTGLVPSYMSKQVKKGWYVQCFLLVRRDMSGKIKMCHLRKILGCDTMVE